MIDFKMTEDPNFHWRDISSNVIKEHEGFEQNAYQDPGGVWTVGYGETEGVTPETVMPQEDADVKLNERVNQFADEVERDFPEAKPHQKTALTSLYYNVGPSRFRESKAFANLQSGDEEGFLREAFDPEIGFVKAGGQVLSGLQKRRQFEKQIYTTPFTPEESRQQKLAREMDHGFSLTREGINNIRQIQDTALEWLGVVNDAVDYQLEGVGIPTMDQATARVDALERGAPVSEQEGFHGAPLDLEQVATEMFGAGILAGPMAKAATGFRGVAEAALNRGVDPEEVWQKTGWTRAPWDGKMRFEIDDSQSNFKVDWDSMIAENPNNLAPKTQPLDKVLDHPTLFQNYPELKKVKFTKQGVKGDVENSQHGSFSKEKMMIKVSPYAPSPMQTLLHEIQHWVQFKEEWAGGGRVGSTRLDDGEMLKALRTRIERVLPNKTDKEAKDLMSRLDRLEKNQPQIQRLYDNLDTHDMNLRASLKQEEKLINSGRDMDEIEKELVILNRQQEQFKKGKEEAQKKLEGKSEGLEYDIYRMIAGEQEANIVAARSKMHPAINELEPPYSPVKKGEYVVPASGAVGIDTDKPKKMEAGLYQDDNGRLFQVGDDGSIFDLEDEE